MRLWASITLSVLLGLAAGCARPGVGASATGAAVPSVTAATSAAGVATVTPADVASAKRVVVLGWPGYDGEFRPLEGDPADRADLDAIGWWRTHRSPPYKSLRLWAGLRHPGRFGAKGTPALSHVWDVVEVSPGSPWVVVGDSNSSE